MVKRGKRIVSKILCATVLFTMTAVPGAVFAEENEAVEASGTGSTTSVDTEAPAAANDTAQTEQKETAPAVQKEEAKAPAQESQTVAPQVQAAKSQVKDSQVATYSFDGVTVSTTPAADNTGTVTVCEGTTVTLKANLINSTDGKKYDYYWYRGRILIAGANNSTYTPTSDGTYHAVVWDRRANRETSSDVKVVFKAHDTVAAGVKQATCTEEGHSAYWTCSRCEKMFENASATKEITQIPTIPKKPHTITTHAVNLAATCTTDGHLEHWACTTCGALFWDQDGTKPATEANVTIPAAHTWAEDYTVDKDPTCTTAGSKSKHCKQCDATTDVTEIPATGHNMTKTDAKAATCTEFGNNEYYTCNTCQKVFKDAAGTEETRVDAETIAALGHNMTKTEAKAATCTEFGNNEYYTCKTCEQVFKDEAGTTPTTVEAEVIEATGHDLTLVEKVDATCLKDGYEAYWECQTCGKIFADEACEKALDAPVVIKATGHKLSDWKVVKEPTLEEAGMKERVCEKCDYAETEAIPALDAAKADLTSKAELNKTKETAEAKSDDSAKTSDDMNVALYSLLALLAASGAAGVAYRRRTTEK